MLVRLPETGFEPILSLLADAGFRRIGFDASWDAVAYDEPTRLRDRPRRAIVRWADAATKLGLRPSALAFGNPGRDAPSLALVGHVRQAAPAGASRLRLDPALVPVLAAGRSGIPSRDRRQRVETLFTAIGADGVVDLARPLPYSIPAGPTPVNVLRFAPFERPTRPDGGANPVFEQTLRGWLDYVQDLCRALEEGTGGAGYDLELYDAGAVFFDRTLFVDPGAPRGPGSASDQIRLAIVERTAAWLRRPGSNCPNARLVDSMSDGRGATPVRAVPGVDMVGRHLAVHAHEVLDWAAGGAPLRRRQVFPELTLLEALDARGTVVGDGPMPLAITSFNLNPRKMNPRFDDLDAIAIERFRAKVLLRTLVAFVGRGVASVDFFRAYEPGVTLLDPAAPDGGAAPRALRRLLAQLEPSAAGRENEEEAPSLHSARPCGEAPGGEARVAYFPFRLGSGGVAAVVYVMTQDLLHPYRPALQEPDAFDRPDQPFVLTLTGTLARWARNVRLYDPVDDRHVAVRAFPGDVTRLVVPLTDSPRVLTFGP
jgi:hypothetical protein